MTEKKLDWFRKAKYGLFVHWGLYAIPGGIWNGAPSPHGSEWIMRNMQIPLKEYRKLTDQFHPNRFDAEAIVRKAKEWGMKYVVVTAKHHDGFSMYDTKVSDYSVMNTPYGKDVIRQFADACEKEHMTLGLYYSQMQDWEHPDGDGNTWDFDPAEKKFRRYFDEKAVPQVKELLTNYGKVGLIWFDTPYDMPVELCRELADVVHSCQPDCLISGRIGYGLGDYRSAADNSVPLLSGSEAWESPMTLNHSWGYSRRDADYKTPAEVIQNLVRVVGRGGNLLLNVGPNADGIVPEESVQVLDRVGEWLSGNGKSIYATASIPNFPYFLPWGDLTYSKEERILYFHIQKYPLFPYRVLLTGLKTKVIEVCLLADGKALKFSQSYEPARNENRLYVFLPEVCPDPEDTVVAVRLDGEAETQAF